MQELKKLKETIEDVGAGKFIAGCGCLLVLAPIVAWMAVLVWGLL